MKNVRKLFLATAIVLLTAIVAQAQVAINLTGNAPNSSAMLDVSATNKGLLIPNVELTGTTDAGPITSPAVSLLVFNLKTVSDVTPGFYYNSGTSVSPVWTRLLVANANLTGEVSSVGNETTVTNSAVIGKVLTGYKSGAGTVAATDNILQAIQKLNANIKLLEDNLVTTGNYKIFDVEGNPYKVVKIGTQTWMAENLKTITYNDGTPITNVTDNSAWRGLTEAYCWYNNDAATYKNTYGALYKWYAVNTAKLCPIGWHVPSDTEWTTLTTYLGGESVAGGKLKETGFTHWISPNSGAINSTGFTALPGGIRYVDGSFSYLGEIGYWWSNSENEITTRAWDRYIGNWGNGVDRNHDGKNNAFSVRCVRD